MKKIILIAGLLLLCSFPATVYAGSLNSYESEVVTAAQGVFESDGVKYKLDSGYVSQLVSYLSSDEVDLNQDQRNQALAAMNDYVEKGIKEGYLVPLDEQNNTKENPEESGSSDQEKSDTDTKETDQKKNTNTKKTEKKKSNTSDTNTSQSTNKDTKSTTAKTAAKESTLSEKKSDDTSASTSKVTPVITQAPEKPANEDEIIKNTGFNFNRTVYVAVGIGVLMMLGIMITYRHNFFAQNDE